MDAMGLALAGHRGPAVVGSRLRRCSRSSSWHDSWWTCGPASRSPGCRRAGRPRRAPVYRAIGPRLFGMFLVRRRSARVVPPHARHPGHRADPPHLRPSASGSWARSALPASAGHPRGPAVARRQPRVHLGDQLLRDRPPGHHAHAGGGSPAGAVGRGPGRDPGSRPAGEPPPSRCGQRTGSGSDFTRPRARSPGRTRGWRRSGARSATGGSPTGGRTGSRDTAGPRLLRWRAARPGPDRQGGRTLRSGPRTAADAASAPPRPSRGTAASRRR